MIITMTQDTLRKRTILHDCPPLEGKERREGERGRGGGGEGRGGEGEGATEKHLYNLYISQNRWQSQMASL